VFKFFSESVEMTSCSTMTSVHQIHQQYFTAFYYTPAPRRGRRVYCFTSVCPSKIFFSATIDGRNLIFGHKLHIGMPYCEQRFWTRQIPTSCLPTLLIFIHIEHICSFFVAFFSANTDGRKSDIWSQASYRYPILWEAFFDPSDSYFLFADLVGFYTHLTYMHILRHIFLSNYWWQESDIWSQASYRYGILWEAFLDPSDSYFLFADLVDFYTQWTYICTFFVTFFSATIDGRNLIFGHNLHIGTPYRGKRF
jgi:hypothetical protein